MKIMELISVIFILKFSLICCQLKFNTENIKTQNNKSLDCENTFCQTPTGDLLSGRRKFLYASSTCGLKYPERYCVLGTKSQQFVKLKLNKQKQTQVKVKRQLKNNIVPRDDNSSSCHICDSRTTYDYSPQSHRIELVVNNDYTEPAKKWWQSENNKDNVYIQFELENEFILSHLFIKFKTFRPATMFIEKSSDYGETWKKIAYFADDCLKSFPDVPKQNGQYLRQNNFGIATCKEIYSRGDPSKDRALVHRILEPNRIKKIDIYSPDVLDVLKVTNIRFNFTKLFRLGDQYFFDEDDEYYEKYYYAITQIGVYGSCMCFGHASKCKILDDTIQYDRQDYNQMTHASCDCKHNTAGLNCERCAALYNDRPWAAATFDNSNACKKCECNGHAEVCEFELHEYEKSGNVSGGVCICLHNTHGKHCQECRVGFYHDQNVPFTHSNACKACACNLPGSTSEFCNTGSESSLPIGQCFCKANVEGRRCDKCKPGFRNLKADNPDGCEPCICNVNGTIANEGCNAEWGQCRCKPNVMGSKCDQCKPNHYGLDDSYEGCKPCECSLEGSLSSECNIITGQCQCRLHMKGRKCDEIEPGFYCPGLDYLTYEAENGVKFNSQANVVEETNLFSYPIKYGHLGPGRRVLVKENGEFSMNINYIEISGLFEILLRYESNDDWKVNMQIRARNDNSNDYEPKCNKYFYETSMTLQNGKRSKITANTFCFDNRRNYEIILKFIPNYYYGSNSNENLKTLLIDSLVLFPVVDKSLVPEGYFNHYLYCKEWFYEYHDRQDYSYCKPYICPVTAQLFGIKPCECDHIGSANEFCNQFGGKCTCRMNTEGSKCNSCARETWGLSSYGCQPCSCGQGAINNFCDILSGQCKCDDYSAGRTCDKCKAGYYGYPPDCKPCSCNGYSNNCDVNNGFCFDCNSNTVGKYCDACEDGYYGDPSRGIPCKKCMCPGVDDVQHASSCKLNKETGRAVCDCAKGYVGEHCDKCDLFYYGNPIEKDNECKKCNCNGNVNETDENSCDSKTGQCNNCLYNTDGNNCEKCKNGYYGSAKQKQCYKCDCEIRGTVGNSTDNCDNISGQCVCLPNVDGKRCEIPKENHYWNPNGNGSLACECDITGTISGSKSCNENTGQCKCNEERGGKNCAECAERKWGDPNEGCKDCECNGPGSNSSRCDKKTGECICKIGVIGKNCDQCARGTTGTAPNCEPCGECFDNWSEILMDLKKKLDNLEEKALASLAHVGNDNFTAFGSILTEIESNLDDVKNLLNSSKDERVKEMHQQISKIKDKLNIFYQTIDGDVKKVREYENTLKFDNIRKEGESIYKNIIDLLKEALSLRESVKNGATASITEYNNQSHIIENKLIDLNDLVFTNLSGLIKQINEESSKFDKDSNESIQKLINLVGNTSVDIKKIMKKLSSANRNVCGGFSLSCLSLCGAAGCNRCGKEGLNMPENPADLLTDVYYDDIDDNESLSIPNDCDASLGALLINYDDVHEKFDKNYKQIEDELKKILIKGNNVTIFIKEANKELKNFDYQALNELNRLKNQLEQVNNFTISITQFKQSFEKLISNIQESVTYLDDVKNPHSQQEFDEIMMQIDKLAVEVTLKADQIRKETSETKKNADELANIVNELKNSQNEILDKSADKENELLNKKEKMNNAENNIKNVEDINKQTLNLLTETNESLTITENKQNNIINKREDIVDTINKNKPILSNELPNLQDKIKERLSVLKNINETIKKLDEETKLLEIKVLSQTTGNFASIEEKRKAFETLNYLKKNIADKYEQLKTREDFLIKIREDIRVKKQELEFSKSKLLKLQEQASAIKIEIQEKLEFYESCQ